MLKAEFNWNMDSDERKIAEARAEIESLNQRIDAFEQEQAQENDEEQEQPEIKWPSLMPKEN